MKKIKYSLRVVVPSPHVIVIVSKTDNLYSCKSCCPGVGESRNQHFYSIRPHGAPQWGAKVGYLGFFSIFC